MSVPTVEITGREIYDLVQDVRREVQEMSGKVDALPTQINDHEGRLRYLERAIWIYTGVAAAGGAGLAQLVARLVER